jgi:hypothetical protein
MVVSPTMIAIPRIPQEKRSTFRVKESKGTCHRSKERKDAKRLSFSIHVREYEETKSGWWFGTFLFKNVSHHIGNVIIPTDELHHFSEG